MDKSEGKRDPVGDALHVLRKVVPDQMLADLSRLRGADRSKKDYTDQGIRHHLGSLTYLACVFLDDDVPDVLLDVCKAVFVDVKPLRSRRQKAGYTLYPQIDHAISKAEHPRLWD
ncbi:MAG: hypothetical protein AAF612_06810 [Planctomycetota bacterium]